MSRLTEPPASMVFQRGDRVRLSAAGLERFPRSVRSREHARAAVVGFGRQSNTIRVKRDGRSEIQTWWAGFWEHDEVQP